MIDYATELSKYTYCGADGRLLRSGSGYDSRSGMYIPRAIKTKTGDLINNASRYILDVLLHNQSFLTGNQSLLTG